jgi:hypothetical protein
MHTPILGQAYVARSINAADNRMVNLFPEATPGDAKEAGFLNRAPGLRLLATIGTGPIRGMWAHNTSGQDAYVASGSEFYKIYPDFTYVKLGNISGTGPVSIADSGTQIAIACNPEMFIYTESTNTFEQVTDPDFAGAVTVSYIDGYFLFNQPDSQILWVTEILNGTQINPLAFAAAESSPDNVVANVVNNREAWIFGENTIEIWYDAGAVPFPLAPIQGAYNEIGCISPFSIAKLDNSLFWLGTDSRGFGIVYRNQGYTGIRVSTHAIEYAIQNYGDITDAVAFTYQQEGHAFYVLNFPSVGKTWVYDVATKAWHERAGFKDGEFARYRPQYQMNFNSQPIVGDYENGNIYALDLDVYSDNGEIQRWVRSWRPIPSGQNNLRRTSQHTLQLDCESGVGLNDGQGQDSQVMLRWSDDGGHTWSNEYWASMGRIGQYGKRVFWRRLGMTLKLRDRVYEVSGTDPNKVVIIGAEILISPTNA